MLTAIILVVSILLAAGFALAWFASPAFRRRIERPKHLFAEQVRQYDETYRESGKSPGEESSDT